MTYEELRQDPAIRTYIQKADESLRALGFTEHSFAHVTKVSETAGYILETLGFPLEQIELVKIAGYLHDIGNLVNRVEHSQSGAVMAFRILDRMEMEPAKIATIVTAIGNHDEGTGVPVDAVSAALILADKSDVRRSRVRNADIATFDIHDRVNYSVKESQLRINEAKTLVKLKLVIDTRYSSVMDYFEIFLERMILCRKAAEKLGLPLLVRRAVRRRGKLQTQEFLRLRVHHRDMLQLPGKFHPCFRRKHKQTRFRASCHNKIFSEFLAELRRDKNPPLRIHRMRIFADQHSFPSKWFEIHHFSTLLCLLHHLNGSA